MHPPPPICVNPIYNYASGSASSPANSFTSHPSPIVPTNQSHQTQTTTYPSSTPLHSPITHSGLSFNSASTQTQPLTFHPPHPPSPFTSYPPVFPSYTSPQSSPLTYHSHHQPSSASQSYFPHTSSGLVTCTSQCANTMPPSGSTSTATSTPPNAGKRSMQDRKESLDLHDGPGKKKRISLSCAQC